MTVQLSEHNSIEDRFVTFVGNTTLGFEIGMSFINLPKSLEKTHAILKVIERESYITYSNYILHGRISRLVQWIF